MDRLCDTSSMAQQQKGSVRKPDAQEAGLSALELPYGHLAELISHAKERMTARLRENISDMQSILDALNGANLGSREANARLAGEINQMAKNYGLQLLYEGSPVNIRCAQGTKTGYFQLRSGAQGSRLHYQGERFPALTVMERGVRHT